MSIIEILSYDLLESSPIFDGDVPSHADKAEIAPAVEALAGGRDNLEFIPKRIIKFFIYVNT